MATTTRVLCLALVLCLAVSVRGEASPRRALAEDDDLAVSRAVVCKRYSTSPNASIIGGGGAEAVIHVFDQFNVIDVAVGLNSTHPAVGSLSVELSAREPCSHSGYGASFGSSSVSCINASSRKTRVLAGVGGKQNSLYNTYFDDYALNNLSGNVKGLAPFTGIYKPSLTLKRLVRGTDGGNGHRAAFGGSHGSWILKMNDRNIAPGDQSRGTIDDMTLILCTRETKMPMPGFVPYAEVMRQPDARPEPAAAVEEEEAVEEVDDRTLEEFLADQFEEASAQSVDEPEVEAFGGGLGKYNPFTQPLQFLFRELEHSWTQYFATRIFIGALQGLIPKDPGPYLLSDPLPYSEEAGP